MSVLSHIDSALSELESAHDEAGLGTQMMIAEIINELRDLRSRVNNINDASE